VVEAAARGDGGGKSVELVSAGDALLRSTTGGGNGEVGARCTFYTPGRCEAGYRRIVSARQRQTSLQRQVFNRRLCCR
jgi:hypothetical protein